MVSESCHDAIPAISKYPQTQHTLSHSHDETQNFVAAYLQNILDNVSAILTRRETSLIQFIQFIQSNSAFFQDRNS